MFNQNALYLILLINLNIENLSENIVMIIVDVEILGGLINIEQGKPQR